MDQIDNVERLEDVLLQHIRTSGMKKSRETSLIDEVLELRRVRRRALSQIAADIDKLQLDNDEIIRQSKGIARSAVIHEKEIEIKVHNEVKRIEQEYREKFSEFAARRDGSIKEFIAKIKQKYENQLVLLENKLADITSEYQNALGDAAIEARKREMMDLQNKLEQQSHKLLRYKEAVVHLSEKERELDAIVVKQRDEIGQLKEEILFSTKRVEDLESSVKHLTEKGVQYQRTMLEKMEVQGRDYSDKIALLESKIGSCLIENETLRAQKKEAEELHASEMQIVDAKIRKALSLKEASISDLERKLKLSERKVMDAEHLIEDLNAGISAVSTRL